MIVRKLSEAKPYEAPNHRDYKSLRVFGAEMGGSQTLVARGPYRPTGSGTEVWQLNANGWRFAPGHVPKLELLGSDPPYGRPSNEPFRVEVTRLDLRLPAREPGRR